MEMKLRGRIIEAYSNGTMVMAFTKADIPYAIPSAVELKESGDDVSIIFGKWIDERTIPQTIFTI